MNKLSAEQIEMARKWLLHISAAADEEYIASANASAANALCDMALESARLREALEFYANPESWKDHPVRGGGESGPVEYECPIGEDVGDFARAALKGTP